MPAFPCLQSLGTMAGTVAMGVAATAMFSALAIDVTDAALLGGVMIGGYAAMSTPSSSGSSSSRKAKAAAKAAGAAGDEVDGAAEEGAAAAAEEQEPRATIGSKASAPGAPRRLCLHAHGWSGLPSPCAVSLAERTLRCPCLMPGKPCLVHARRLTVHARSLVTMCRRHPGGQRAERPGCRQEDPGLPQQLCQRRGQRVSSGPCSRWPLRPQPSELNTSQSASYPAFRINPSPAHAPAPCLLPACISWWPGRPFSAPVYVEIVYAAAGLPACPLVTCPIE